MFHRITKFSKSQSFFVFGARGTGKSTLLKERFLKNAHYIDLLKDEWESRYIAKPDRLIEDIEGLKQKPEWVIIDEVQKIPKLLDVVHHLIESKKIKFILTGSSARKLKRGSGNLLAGRAFFYQLFPLTYRELEGVFDLQFVLDWGSLPHIYSFEDESDRIEYLRSYAQTYLKEEILQEQIVRNGVAFRQFLEVAAQENGMTLNFSKIARDVGVDYKTAQAFFQILEDTLVGFFLQAYSKSVRKSVKLQPKFYLFDCGIKKALDLTLKQSLVPKTNAYGRAFEHFIVLECFRLNQYTASDYKLSHYQTTAGGEIDLVLSRDKQVIAIEIKSSDKIDLVEVKKMSRVAEALKASKLFYVSQDKTRSKIGNVQCLYWKDFLEEIFK